MFGSSSSASPPTNKRWFTRLQDSLKKTRNKLKESLSNVFLGKKVIASEWSETLETALLTADVGVNATTKILDNLTKHLSRQSLDDSEALISALKHELLDLLMPCEEPLNIDKSPFVILVVGVNGAGKTTTIAKLAHYYQSQGKKVMLAAGDTFRAAAIDQLQSWGDKNAVPVISQHPGADSASVIFDAMQAASTRGYDILIADTAGRLHTQANLMAELQKIKRVMTKQNANAPHEIMLVLDASTGQNALQQTEQFFQAIGVTGITLTKLDGTAKGGVIFSIAEKMRLPFRFITLGETINDLQIFSAKSFVDAILPEDQQAKGG